MGAAASIDNGLYKEEDIVNSIISIRPDWKGKDTKQLLHLVSEDLKYAKVAHDSNPNGMALDNISGNDVGLLDGVLTKIGHICRVVKDADISKNFYHNIIGAKLLNRPLFPTNGYWLWLGNVQLHLIQSDLWTQPDHKDAGTKVNHISFDVYDFGECEKRLIGAGIKYKKVFVPVGDNKGINQLFFQDPDGHWVELCDCFKMNDFIYGAYNLDRAKEMAKYYAEGIDKKGLFMSTIILSLLGNNSDGLKNIFEIYAGDDHKITNSELSMILKKIDDTVDDVCIDKLFKSIDKDSNGIISFDEFELFVKMIFQTYDDDLVRNIFYAIDTTSSGNITEDRLREFVTAIGLKLENIDDKFFDATVTSAGDSIRIITMESFIVLFKDAVKHSVHSIVGN